MTFYVIFIGKLQVLDRLLRQLKADHHRVLIFTQMTRMLDVLEAFLNFHGHIYLRLDGTTRIDQRQVCGHCNKLISCYLKLKVIKKTVKRFIIVLYLPPLHSF